MKIEKRYAREIQVQYIKRDNVLSTKVTSSKDAADYMRALYPCQIEYREAFSIILLNRANETIGYHVISIGASYGTVVDKKMIFQSCLLSHAQSFIMVHNHPSGNLKPSQSDLQLTKEIVSLAKQLGVPCLDHLILTEITHFSFADDGILN